MSEADVRDEYRDARKYDFLNSKNKDDIPFWLKVCRKYKPAALLELGVGTGRIAIPLAKEGRRAGFTVTGVDITPEMLERARAKLSAEDASVRGNLALLEGDIRTYIADESYDLIFVAFNGLVHLLGLEDRRQAFASAYASLRQGGRFIVDVFNPNLVVQRMPSDPSLSTGQVGQLGRQLARAFDRGYDGATQTMWARHFFESYATARRRQEERLPHHVYSAEELRPLFTETGFEVEAAFGDYRMGELTARSPRVIFVGRKPAGHLTGLMGRP